MTGQARVSLDSVQRDDRGDGPADDPVSSRRGRAAECVVGATVNGDDADLVLPADSQTNLSGGSIGEQCHRVGAPHDEPRLREQQHGGRAVNLTGYMYQDRPSTKVHAAPGGDSSLGYLFGGGSS